MSRARDESSNPAGEGSIGIEHGIHADGESGQDHRGRRVAPTKYAVLNIGSSIERQYGYRLVVGIDDPVLGHFALGIVMAFVDQIARRLVLAHNLQGQVGTGPESVRSVRVLRVFHAPNL